MNYFYLAPAVDSVRLEDVKFDWVDFATAPSGYTLVDVDFFSACIVMHCRDASGLPVHCLIPYCAASVIADSGILCATEVDYVWVVFAETDLRIVMLLCMVVFRKAVALMTFATVHHVHHYEAFEGNALSFFCSSEKPPCCQLK